MTDLEFAAVKFDKWPETANEALIIFRGTGFYWRGDYVFKQGCERVYFQQWQNMRYYLGLDKKPHCKSVGGEWVEK